MAKRWGPSNPLWKWKHKKKRKKRSRATRKASKKVYRMARRRYKRGRRGGSRGVSVSLTDVGYLAAVAVEVGIIPAITTMQTSGIGAGLQQLGSSFTLQKAVNVALTTGIYGLAKKVLPSRNLISFGKFHIKS